MGDRLSMHYKGTLASNGNQFDSSYDRGKPFQFKIAKGEVIRGWDDGVMQMSLGEKAKLLITSDFGYGAEGIGPIPPHADLVFEVELLKIGDQAADIPREGGCCTIL
jgi:FK506-binding protein 1